MNSVLKTIAATFPIAVQQELKRFYFAHQIRKERFVTDEKEFALLHNFISPGDWVLDIGANIGHYTKRFSDLAGASGRVIAFEPVPDTFELLAANVQRFCHKNVSLFNAAASHDCASHAMSIPTLSTGLSNYYEAHLTADHGSLNVLTIPVGTLPLPHSICLIKIDAEGHEMAALEGMENLLQRDHPTLIVETFSEKVAQYLAQFGYRKFRLDGSSNGMFSVKELTLN